MALVAFCPVFAAVALAIKVEDGGPVFFSQERVGLCGHIFRCHKFRTMLENAEELLMRWKHEGHPNWTRYVESNFKLQDDPRVTRVGKFIRRTSIDELPQLINILRGEMNLVGPRPILPREITDYGEESFAKYRLMTPGLTGLWQVSGRSDTSFARRAELDCQYYERRSFGYDMALIVRTVGVLFKRSGAY
jgi:lipopolysaccharide/colanic/teichoic acid biosynthesis glycosyltransferase